MRCRTEGKIFFAFRWKMVHCGGAICRFFRWHFWTHQNHVMYPEGSQSYTLSNGVKNMEISSVFSEWRRKSDHKLSRSSRSLVKLKKKSHKKQNTPSHRKKPFLTHSWRVKIAAKLFFPTNVSMICGSLHNPITIQWILLWAPCWRVLPVPDHILALKSWSCLW